MFDCTGLATGCPMDFWGAPRLPGPLSPSHCIAHPGPTSPPPSYSWPPSLPQHSGPTSLPISVKSFAHFKAQTQDVCVILTKANGPSISPSLPPSLLCHPGPLLVNCDPFQPPANVLSPSLSLGPSLQLNCPLSPCPIPLVAMGRPSASPST